MTTPTLGDRIANRIKDSCRAQGLDPQIGLRRYSVEQILSGFRAVYPNLFIVNGGLIHDQRVRETDDADIRFIRKATNEEILQAFIRMAPLIEHLGIRFEKIYPAEYLDMPNGVPGMRFRYRCWIGSSRVDNKIEMGFSDGRKCAFPTDWNTELPTWIKSQPVFKGRAAKFETQVAEKLVTILTRGESNTRAKDYADIAMLSTDLDNGFLAKEIARVIEDRRLSSEIISSVPDGLDLSLLQSDQKVAEWNSFVAKRKRSLDMTETLCSVRQLYAQVRVAARAIVVKRELEEKTAMEVLEHAKAQAELQTLIDQQHAMRLPKPRLAMKKKVSNGNIIDLDRYRHTAPGM